MDPEVVENRTLFVDLAIAHHLKVANTFFIKPPQKLCTYKAPGIELGPPRQRYNYEQVDFVLVQDRWFNNFLDVEAQPTCNAASDHFPISVNVKLVLKANKHRPAQALNTVRAHRRRVQLLKIT